MAVGSVVRAIGRQGLTGALVDALARVLPRRRDALGVLTFHRIADPAGVVPGIVSATPDGFSDLLDGLVARYRILSVEDLLERRRGGPRLPSRSLLLTFDDAYTDFAEHAWPALRARQLPVVLFVPTAYPDRPDRTFWWERVHAAIRATDRGAVMIDGERVLLASPDDRLRAYRRLRARLKQLPDAGLKDAVGAIEAALGFTTGARPAPSGRVLSWDQLRELRSAGVALASHTRTHPLLTQVDESRLANEIDGGIADLRRETGSELPVFAYPAGAVGPAARDAAERAGLKLAFTTRRGVNDLGRGRWLELDRINVGARTPPPLLFAQYLR